ncbi:hypothetical protein ABPG74_019948 [Tetrahymena malaccensis]
METKIEKIEDQIRRFKEQLSQIRTDEDLVKINDLLVDIEKQIQLLQEDDATHQLKEQYQQMLAQIYCDSGKFQNCQNHYLIQNENGSINSIECQKEKKIYLLLGNTGTGKSSFIRTITQNNNIQVSNSKQSVTLECQKIEYDKIVFIDTPGINDTQLSRFEVLLKIVKFLHNQNINIDDLFILHIQYNQLRSNDILRDFSYTYFLYELVKPNANADENLVYLFEQLTKEYINSQHLMNWSEMAFHNQENDLRQKIFLNKDNAANYYDKIMRYHIRIKTKFDYEPVQNLIMINNRKIETLKEQIWSEKYQENNFQAYNLHIKDQKANLFRKIKEIQKQEAFNNSIDENNDIQYILIIGASQVGKSSLIQQLTKLQYLSGSGEKSCTKNCSIYRVDYQGISYKFIDTPGFQGTEDYQTNFHNFKIIADFMRRNNIKEFKLLFMKDFDLDIRDTMQNELKQFEIFITQIFDQDVSFTDNLYLQDLLYGKENKDSITQKNFFKDKMLQIFRSSRDQNPSDLQEDYQYVFFKSNFISDYNILIQVPQLQDQYQKINLFEKINNIESITIEDKVMFKIKQYLSQGLIYDLNQFRRNFNLIAQKYQRISEIQSNINQQDPNRQAQNQNQEVIKLKTEKLNLTKVLKVTSFSVLGSIYDKIQSEIYNFQYENKIKNDTLRHFLPLNYSPLLFEQTNKFPQSILLSRKQHYYSLFAHQLSEFVKLDKHSKKLEKLSDIKLAQEICYHQIEHQRIIESNIEKPAQENFDKINHLSKQMSQFFGNGILAYKHATYISLIIESLNILPFYTSVSWADLFLAPLRIGYDLYQNYKGYISKKQFALNTSINLTSGSVVCAMFFVPVAGLAWAALASTGLFVLLGYTISNYIYTSKRSFDLTIGRAFHQIMEEKSPNQQLRYFEISQIFQKFELTKYNDLNQKVGYQMFRKLEKYQLKQEDQLFSQIFEQKQQDIQKKQQNLKDKVTNFIVEKYIKTLFVQEDKFKQKDKEGNKQYLERVIQQLKDNLQLIQTYYNRSDEIKQLTKVSKNALSLMETKLSFENKQNQNQIDQKSKIQLTAGERDILDNYFKQINRFYKTISQETTYDKQNKYSDGFFRLDDRFEILFNSYCSLTQTKIEQKFKQPTISQIKKDEKSMKFVLGNIEGNNNQNELNYSIFQNRDDQKLVKYLNLLCVVDKYIVNRYLQKIKDIDIPNLVCFNEKEAIDADLEYSQDLHKLIENKKLYTVDQFINYVKNYIIKNSKQPNQNECSEEINKLLRDNSEMIKRLKQFFYAVNELKKQFKEEIQPTLNFRTEDFSSYQRNFFEIGDKYFVEDYGIDATIYIMFFSENQENKNGRSRKTYEQDQKNSSIIVVFSLKKDLKMRKVGKIQYKEEKKILRMETKIEDQIRIFKEKLSQIRTDEDLVTMNDLLADIERQIQLLEEDDATYLLFGYYKYMLAQICCDSGKFPTKNKKYEAHIRNYQEDYLAQSQIFLQMNQQSSNNNQNPEIQNENGQNDFIVDEKVKKIYLVLGNTGVGKSSFVRAITQNPDIQVSDSQQSVTQECQKFEYDNFIYIDTPGINDTRMHKFEVLLKIVKFLYDQQIKLDNLFILHIQYNELRSNDILRDFSYTYFLYELFQQNGYEDCIQSFQQLTNEYIDSKYLMNWSKMKFHNKKDNLFDKRQKIFKNKDKAANYYEYIMCYSIRIMTKFDYTPVENLKTIDNSKTENLKEQIWSEKYQENLFYAYNLHIKQQKTHLFRKIKQIQILEDFNNSFDENNDIQYILIIGASQVGKSAVIQQLTKLRYLSGSGRNSFTNHCSIYRVDHQNITYKFIDTPGFSGTEANQTNFHNFKIIADFMRRNSIKEFKLLFMKNFDLDTRNTMQNELREFKIFITQIFDQDVSFIDLSYLKFLLYGNEDQDTKMINNFFQDRLLQIFRSSRNLDVSNREESYQYIFFKSNFISEQNRLIEVPQLQDQYQKINLFEKINNIESISLEDKVMFKIKQYLSQGVIYNLNQFRSNFNMIAQKYQRISEIQSNIEQQNANGQAKNQNQEVIKLKNEKLNLIKDLKVTSFSVLGSIYDKIQSEIYNFQYENNIKNDTLKHFLPINYSPLLFEQTDQFPLSVLLSRKQHYYSLFAHQLSKFVQLDKHSKKLEELSDIKLAQEICYHQTEHQRIIEQNYGNLAEENFNKLNSLSKNINLLFGYGISAYKHATYISLFIESLNILPFYTSVSLADLILAPLRIGYDIYQNYKGYISKKQFALNTTINITSGSVLCAMFFVPVAGLAWAALASTGLFVLLGYTISNYIYTSKRSFDLTIGRAFHQIMEEKSPNQQLRYFEIANIFKQFKFTKYNDVNQKIGYELFRKLEKYQLEQEDLLFQQIFKSEKQQNLKDEVTNFIVEKYIKNLFVLDDEFNQKDIEGNKQYLERVIQQLKDNLQLIQTYYNRSGEIEILTQVSENAISLMKKKLSSENKQNQNQINKASKIQLSVDEKYILKTYYDQISRFCNIISQKTTYEKQVILSDGLFRLDDRFEILFNSYCSLTQIKIEEKFKQPTISQIKKDEKSKKFVLVNNNNNNNIEQNELNYSIFQNRDDQQLLEQLNLLCMVHKYVDNRYLQKIKGIDMPNLTCLAENEVTDADLEYSLDLHQLIENEKFDKVDLFIQQVKNQIIEKSKQSNQKQNQQSQKKIKNLLGDNSEMTKRLKYFFQAAEYLKNYFN